MELQQLRYFVAAADLESFTRAAQRCLVAQPSLSQQIGKLELELRTPLFDRLGRAVKLTDAGRSLYEQATAILAAVDEAKARVGDCGAAAHGVVALGAIPTVAPYLLPSLLERFLTEYPRAEVIVHEDLTAQTIKGCVTGELDLGIVALPVAEEQLIVETLFTEELKLAMPSDHPLAHKRRITMRDVSREPFILLSETHCLGEQILSFCKQQTCLPQVSCRSAQLLTVQELVAIRHGVSLIPAMACALDRSQRRTYRSLAGPRPTRTLAIIWNRHRYQNRLIHRFVDHLRAHAKKQHGPRGSRP